MREMRGDIYGRKVVEVKVLIAIAAISRVSENEISMDVGRLTLYAEESYDEIKKLILDATNEVLE